MALEASTPSEHLVRQAYRWLSERHTTLWAHHEIQSEEGRMLAARWFANEVESFLDHSEAPMYAKHAQQVREGWDVT